MSKLLERLNVVAICLLGGVLASVLAVQVWPGVRLLAGVGTGDDPRVWPKTLQVYPAHPGDPVRLIRITKGGKEVLPGTYAMPEITGKGLRNGDALKEWLKDASFTLKSQTSKNIVSVGMAVVFSARDTDLDCISSTGPWCDANPHWCDGGCPELLHTTLHWGLIPALTASGLEGRYARARAEGKHWRTLLQGESPLQLAAGEEMMLCPAGRVDGIMTHTDPRHPFSAVTNGIVEHEGIDEATGTEPCVDRVHSKTGCAFTEVSKFNIGVDIVYFEDGTIWGNYGYGYALPNPNGIFTRVDARDFPGLASPAPAAK
jgi:hypothetical protein